MRLAHCSWLPLALLIAVLSASPASAECTAFRPWPEFTRVAPLRGAAAADTMRINGLVSPLAPVGHFDCPPDNPLWVRIGWQIAIAFDGRYPGVKGPVTTVAVITGRPDPDNPRLQKLSYADVVAATGLPGTDQQAPQPLPASDIIGNVALSGGLPIGAIVFLGLRRRAKRGAQATHPPP